MKAPRIAIASVMLAVAIVALDFGAIRSRSDVRSRSRNQLRRVPNPAEFERIQDSLMRADLLVSGALPMGNILAAVGLLVRQRQRSRPFLLGFAVFGAAALAGYIAAVSCITYEQLRPYLDLTLEPLKKSISPSPALARPRSCTSSLRRCSSCHRSPLP